MISPVQRRELGESLLWMLASSLLMLVAALTAQTLRLPLSAALATQTLVGIGAVAVLAAAASNHPLRVGRVAAAPLALAIVLGVGLALLGSGSLSIFWNLSDAAREALSLRSAVLTPLVASTPMLALFVVAVLPAVCEEIFYRGALRETLASFGVRARVLGTAALFSLAHLDPWSAPALFVVGLALGYLAERMGGWALPTAAHLVLNAFGIFVWSRLYPGAPPPTTQAVALLGLGAMISLGALVAICKTTGRNQHRDTP